MDAKQFDAVTRLLTSSPSRRGLVQSLGAAAGLTALAPLGVAAGKKNKKKKLAFNQYGCLNAGQKCRGQSALCCSGSCQGNKPKKGEKDKRVCVAHHTASCAADTCQSEYNVPCGAGGICTVTTGQAFFCANPDLAGCTACQTDADCVPAFGPGSACVVCPSLCSTGTVCAAPAV